MRAKNVFIATTDNCAKINDSRVHSGCCIDTISKIHFFLCQTRTVTSCVCIECMPVTNAIYVFSTTTQRKKKKNFSTLQRENLFNYMLRANVNLQMKDEFVVTIRIFDDTTKNAFVFLQYSKFIRRIQ